MKKIKLDIKPNGVAHLIMNDREGKNIFTHSFINDFVQGMDELEKIHKPKVVVLRGLEDVFCGGADKQSLLNLCEGKLAVVDLILSERLIHAPFPIIAAMEGHAMGGGLVVGLCSDIVIAARESRYGAVFISLGFTPGMGCTTLLPELVGPYIANEMMYTGKRFRGSELIDKGTHINYILPKKEVLPKADTVALQIGEKNIKSLYLLKNTLSAKKKKLLIDARLQEDLMHRISFSFPETKAKINELYID